MQVIAGRLVAYENQALWEVVKMIMIMKMKMIVFLTSDNWPQGTNLQLF